MVSMWFAALATVALVLGTAPASAQVWPTRPITLVVTFAAGSSDDVLGRILSPRLTELLGQQVVVENVGGAGGMNGVSRVARAAPDGYQFVIGGIGRQIGLLNRDANDLVVFLAARRHAIVRDVGQLCELIVETRFGFSGLLLVAGYLVVRRVGLRLRCNRDH